MKFPIKGQVLRIFIGADDTSKGRPLYEEIVKKARELNLAGATVFRGIMGYGAASRIHTAKVLRLSEDLPIVVEIVDEAERIDLIIPFLDETVQEGLITRENITVVQYRHNK
jgi:PII-like signaling protein